MRYTLTKYDPLDEQIYCSKTPATGTVASAEYIDKLYVLNGHTPDNRVFFYEVDRGVLTLREIKVSLDTEYSSPLFVSSGVTDVSTLDLVICGNALIHKQDMVALAKLESAIYTGYVVIRIDMETLYYSTDETLTANVTLLTVGGSLDLGFDIERLLTVYSERLYLLGKQVGTDIWNKLFIIDFLNYSASYTNISQSLLVGKQSFAVKGSKIYFFGGQYRSLYEVANKDVQSIIYVYDVSNFTWSSKTILPSATYQMPNPLYSSPLYVDDKYIYILDKEHTPKKIHVVSLDILEIVGTAEVDADITANNVVRMGVSRLFYFDTRICVAWIVTKPGAGEPIKPDDDDDPDHYIKTNQKIIFFDHYCRYNGEILMNYKTDTRIDNKKFITIYR